MVRGSRKCQHDAVRTALKESMRSLRDSMGSKEGAALGDFCKQELRQTTFVLNLGLKIHRALRVACRMCQH
jgi:hypothetical protein